MNFSDIPAGENLKKTISDAVSQDRMPHAVLITGGGSEDRLSLARLIAAAAECSGGGEKPCMKCDNCRRVMKDIHQDVELFTPDEGRIKAKTAREIQANAYVRPGEGGRHVFIIHGADSLMPDAQNVLLKTLEEPPGSAMFILTAESAGSLLVTVRSRCVNYHLSAREDRKEIPESVTAFMRTLEKNDALECAVFMRGMEKLKREEIAAFVRDCGEFTARALRGKYVSGGTETSITAAALVRLSFVFDKATEYIKSNCGVGSLCGWLAVSCWEAMN